MFKRCLVAFYIQNTAWKVISFYLFSMVGSDQPSLFKENKAVPFFWICKTEVVQRLLLYQSRFPNKVLIFMCHL